jgi:Tol biopolymer transport system component
VATANAGFGVAGNPYSSTLVATGGVQPYTWAVVTGLPGWATLNPATAQIVGTPLAANVGTSNPVFQVTDAAGSVASRTVFLAVHPRTDLVSVTSQGASGNGASVAPSISGDGSLIVFASLATNFVTGVVGQQIFLHDRGSNQVSLVSADNSAAANAGNAASSAPVISLDGTAVAFVSMATNLLAPAVPSVVGQQVYVTDAATGLNSLVSQNTGGTPGNGTSSAPAINSNGRFVAFVSDSTNLVTGVTGQQVYLRDRQTNQTSLISQTSGAGNVAGNGASMSPAISADGRFVAFVSLSTNLVSLVSGQQVYLRDTLTNQTTLISQSTGGTPGSGLSSTPSISSNGPFAKVAFASSSANLVGVVTGTQIYLRDTQTGITSVVSLDNNVVPVAGTGQSSAPAISSDGRFVAFTSQATNLLAPGTPSVNAPQIYLRDTVGNLTLLVSQNDSGTPSTAGATNLSPVVTTNGAYVAFVSSATNLVSTPLAAPADVYVRAIP